MKRIAKACSALLLLVVCVVAGIGGFFGLKGYRLYQSSVQKTPLSQVVSDIQNMDHFIQYDDLPQTYIDAVISVEDHRFYKHHGLDFIAIGRAIFANLKSHSFAQGGSTITQQLAKNLLFTQEKTLERKAAEVFAVFDLEKNYTKQELFELYVNTIYFGSGYYGIYDAAMGYYNKAPSQLNDYECVMLAGLPNAPSAYSPTTDPQLAKERMQQVLRRMLDTGVITEQRAEEISAAE